jgi:site-specific recombinase XerD
MARGAAVIRYAGKRGVVWYVKYRDATGRQVKERLGREDDGWDEKKAREALSERLVDVRRDGLQRREPVKFDAFAREWLDTYPARKGLKRSTRQGYEQLFNKHLSPKVGHLRLDAIDAGTVDRYVAAKQHEGLAPRTVNRHLNLLHLIFAAAQRRQLVRLNPVELVDRPKEPRRRWTILTQPEISAIERAFTELAAAEESTTERTFLEQARVVFLVVFALGLRRGEVLGLRWRHVHLADPDGATVRIEETWTRSAFDTPKSQASERTLSLGRRVSELLWEHRRTTAFAGDDDLVFPHPQKGTPLDPARYADVLRAALKKAGIEKPLRPFHDGRHSSLTNAAAAGLAPAALQARAGHASFSTTQAYIDLAGVRFRDEAERVEARILGGEEPNSVPTLVPTSPDLTRSDDTRPA